jgi:hypothetical protein
MAAIDLSYACPLGALGPSAASFSRRGRRSRERKRRLGVSFIDISLEADCVDRFPCWTKSQLVIITMGSSEEQLKVYKEVFAQFDTDGSGAVDTDEMATMVESLGMLVTKTELAAMIKAADADGSGEIEFNEFVQVIETAAAQGVAAKGGMSFSALISRRANSGPPMCWRGDKAGPGIAVDAAKTTATREGEGWGVQLLDCWMSGSGFDIASCLLEFEYPLSVSPSPSMHEHHLMRGQTHSHQRSDRSSAPPPCPKPHPSRAACVAGRALCRCRRSQLQPHGVERAFR